MQRTVASWKVFSVKEGVLLHDSKRFSLARPKAQTPEERLDIALQNFRYWFGSAIEFWVGARFCAARRTYSADLRIRVRATGLATYADASVVCDPALRDPDSPTHITNPTVVFEVLSPSTEFYDRGEKREHYQQIDTLREYVLLSQDKLRIDLWSRRSVTDEWSYSVHVAGDAVDLRSIACRLDLSELYVAAGIGR